MSRLDRFIEAARLTGLARELAERSRYEGQQATVQALAATSEESKAEATARHAFAAEITAKARQLTDEADAIYRSLRP